jgi:hypothetical protein
VSLTVSLPRRLSYCVSHCVSPTETPSPWQVREGARDVLAALFPTLPAAEPSRPAAHTAPSATPSHRIQGFGSGDAGGGFGAGRAPSLSTSSYSSSGGGGGSSGYAGGSSSGGGTAIKKLRIVISGFGTARQKLVLE